MNWFGRLFCRLAGIIRRAPQAPASELSAKSAIRTRVAYAYSLTDSGKVCLARRATAQGKKSKGPGEDAWPVPPGAPCCQVVWGEESLGLADGSVWADAARVATWLLADNAVEPVVTVVRPTRWDRIKFRLRREECWPPLAV